MGSAHRTEPPAARAALRLAGLLLAAVLALGARPARPALAGPAGSGEAVGVRVTYPAGWNLVAFPPGTDLSQVPGPFYSYVPSTSSYQPEQPDQPAFPATGYWVYFAAPTTVVLGAGSGAPASAGIIPGEWVMLGDPSGTTPAIIKQGQGTIAYTYDPLDGYQLDTRGFLLPGEGVWVTLAEGLHPAPTIDPSLMLPLGASSLDLTTPCAAILATQGQTAAGSGDPVGSVDGQQVSMCFAAGPIGTLPASNRIGCLLVGEAPTTIDDRTACGPVQKVVQKDADRLLLAGEISADLAGVQSLTWTGSGFRSTGYTACWSDLTLPVTSAGQCSP